MSAYYFLLRFIAQCPVHVCFKGGDQQQQDAGPANTAAVLSMTFAQVRQLLDLVMTPDWATYFAERETAFHFQHLAAATAASTSVASSEHHRQTTAHSPSAASNGDRAMATTNKKYPRVKPSHAAALLEK
jgi:hypothetical protein